MSDRILDVVEFHAYSTNKAMAAYACVIDSPATIASLAPLPSRYKLPLTRAYLMSLMSVLLYQEYIEFSSQQAYQELKIA